MASGTGSGNTSRATTIALAPVQATGIRADDTIAIGTGAQANKDHSSAIGAGAVANKDHQMVFGTHNDTYTTPGITSGKSANRQSGPLEVVTSDAGGNLATDGGDIPTVEQRRGKMSDSASPGVALAISMENPDLTGNERFGVAMNYGNFEGASALSWSAMGVLGYDVLSGGDRVAVSGGFGVGFEDGSGDDVWGGRVGAQWTWGRRAVPYVLK